MTQIGGEFHEPALQANKQPAKRLVTAAYEPSKACREAAHQRRWKASGRNGFQHGRNRQRENFHFATGPIFCFLPVLTFCLAYYQP